MRRILSLLAAGLLWYGLTTMAHADQTDDYVKAQMQKEHIPGLSLAVIRDGKVVKAQGYGLANVELSVSATPDTVYEIGSVTKQFTATLIMMLVEQGKVGLEEKIGTYLTGLPDAWNAITVRQLLTHTSGIKNYTSVPDFEKRTIADVTKEEVIKSVASFPLDFTPGSKWSYSNTGYFLLGMIVEKASGKPYEEFLKERILTPLQMDATQMNNLRRVIPNRASGYEWQGKNLVNASYISMSWPYAAGAIVSTVKDMVKWDAALYTDKLLKAASFQQMWTPVKLNDGKTFGYGFGWSVDKVNGHAHVSHSGGIPGFTSHITRFPDDKLTVIAFANQMANTGRIAEGVAGLYLPAVAPPTEKPIADKEPQITAQIKALFAQFAEGRFDKALFTPELAAEVESQLKGGVSDFLKSQGPMQSMALVQRKEEEQKRVYVYRLIYKDAALLMTCAYDKDAKIAGLNIRPD